MNALFAKIFVALSLFCVPFSFSINRDCRDLYTKVAAIDWEPSRVDEVLLKKWVDAHQGEAKDVAEFLSKHYQLISFPEFKSQLLSAFDRYLHSLAPSDKVVFFYVTKYSEPKSGEWLTGMIKEHYSQFRETPAFNMYGGGLVEMGKLLGEGKANRIVIVDDAIFSGDQIQTLVDAILQSSSYGGAPIPVDIIAPYYTKRGINYIKESVEPGIGNIQTLNFYGSVEIPTIAQLFLRSGKPELITTFKEMYGMVDDRSLTYFAHKVPDGLSSLSPFTLGTVTPLTKQDQQSKISIPFLIERPSPYKE